MIGFRQASTTSSAVSDHYFAPTGVLRWKGVLDQANPQRMCRAGVQYCLDRLTSNGPFRSNGGYRCSFQAGNVTVASAARR